MNPCSILMPTSPIPSNPSTEMIEQNIAKARAYPALRDCEIIIMCDGVRSEQEHQRAPYEEFKRNLHRIKENLGNTKILEFPEHTHQANMTRRALEMVETPLIAFIEHDFWPQGEIDFDGIFRVLLNQSAVKVVRLYASHVVYDSSMMLFPDKLNRFTLEGVPLIKTIQWSQNPHIATTAFYRWMIKEFFGTKARAMIEAVMAAVVANQCGHLVSHGKSSGLSCMHRPACNPASIAMAAAPTRRTEHPGL